MAGGAVHARKPLSRWSVVAPYTLAPLARSFYTRPADEIRVHMIPDQELRDIVLAFRQAIECCHRTKLGPMFRYFPRGCCDIASEMLGKFLQDKYGLRPVYVSAETCDNHKPRTHHAWIELGAVIVDITGDQFGRSPVEVTCDRSWHDQWTNRRSRLLAIDQAWWGRNCAGPYAVILSYLGSVSL